MTQINLPTTGDRVLDTLLTYAIMDIGLKVDPNIKFEVKMGEEIFLSIKSKMSSNQLGREIINKLRNEGSRKFSIADNLNFLVNVGNKAWYIKNPHSVCVYCTGKRDCGFSGKCGKTNILAYAVFIGYLESMNKFRFPWNFKPISKKIQAAEKDYYATVSYTHLTLPTN